jgi:hypothetical protein
VTDYRQEARERFDRLMRLPDSIAEWVTWIGFVSPFVILPGVFLTPGRADQDVFLLICVYVGGFALIALYYAARFTAAITIAALAVRRRDRANGRGGADRPSGTPANPAQNVRSLVAGN